VVFVLTFALGAAACRASVKGDASVTAGRGDEEAGDIDGPSEQPASGDNADNADVAMLGARHDLRLSPEIKTAKCRCLAVALGTPTNSAMSWRGTPASIDPRSQLVIAFSSDAQQCPGEPQGSLGASYWGYRMSGNDVVVVIEAARDGRPVTTGAIIPKPNGEGQVVVQPLTRDLPYGQSLSGGESCPLGNPGARR
jgi:hypothetical protein